MRRARSWTSVVVGITIAQALGCTKSAKPSVAEAIDASTSASPNAAASSAKDAAHLSAPIAAAHTVGGAVFVAGLVVPDKAIAITKIEANGATAWTRNVLDAIEWSSDAEVRVFATSDGVFALWHGTRGGKVVRQIVSVSGSGDVRGAPSDVGAAICATESEIAWSASVAKETKIRIRGAGSADTRDAFALPLDREPVLVCGAHRVFALGDGDDDVIVRTNDGASTTSLVVLRDADFPADEEREHGEYTVGDDLGFVRVGSSGVVSIRELHGAALTAWRTTKTRILRDDDIVAIDADANAAYVIYTHDASDACAKDGATSAASVHALRIDRASGAETTINLAPADCARDIGPFWTGAVAGELTIGWPERVHKVDPTTAPIAGLAYRIAAKPNTSLQKVVRPSDRIVDAGCDATHCYAVALARAPGTDDMIPEVAQVIAYPL